jgi:hypothetical protein
MGEVERAQALLQAAGVSGVKVQEQAEMVTMSRAEADALRAGATPETPGQAYVRQQDAAQVAAAQPPAGIMSEAEMKAHEHRPTPKSWAEQKAQMAEGDRFLESFKYHQGTR